MGNSTSSSLSSPSLDLVFQTVVPSLGYTHTKGQHGHVAVIGGSMKNSGAPYYAAQTALNIGCDLVTIYSTACSSTAIKSYSPALSVDPIIPSQNLILTLTPQLASFGAVATTSLCDFLQRYCNSIGMNFTPEDRAYVKKYAATNKDLPTLLASLTPIMVHLMAKAVSARTRLNNAVVVGPGLGSDEISVDAVSSVLEEVKMLATPVVIDADGISLLYDAPVDTTLRITEGFENMIITTNNVEFKRLATHVGSDIKNFPDSSEKRVGALLTRLDHIFTGKEWEVPSGIDMNMCYSRHVFILTKYLHSRESFPTGLEDFEVLRAYVTAIHDVSKRLGGPTIVLKGAVDIIVNKYHAVVIIHPGAPKRCGGLGDVLAGCIAGYAGFFNVRNKRVYASYEEPPVDVKFLLEDDTINSAVLGCVTSKVAQYKAFITKGRSMTAADVMEQVSLIMSNDELNKSLGELSN